MIKLKIRIIIINYTSTSIDTNVEKLIKIANCKSEIGIVFSCHRKHFNLVKGCVQIIETQGNFTFVIITK